MEAFRIPLSAISDFWSDTRPEGVWASVFHLQRDTSVGQA